MGNLASPSDAQLIMQLYDLRREAELRKARNFIGQFSPKGADEVVALFNNFSAQENAWLRQVISYWEMAASFVLHGSINEELFMESAGEMFFIFAKFQPMIEEIRKKMNSPEFFSRTESLISRSPQSRERLKGMLERFERMRAAMASAK